MRSDSRGLKRQESGQCVGLTSNLMLLICKTELRDFLLQEVFPGVLLVNNQIVLDASFYSHQNVLPMCFPYGGTTPRLCAWLSPETVICRRSEVYLLPLHISGALCICVGQVSVRAVTKLRCQAQRSRPLQKMTCTEAQANV